MEPTELARLLQGRPNFNVFTSKSQVAAGLWDYGEDDLAARAIGMTEDELVAIEHISAWYERPDYPLPVPAGSPIATSARSQPSPCSSVD